MLRITIDLVPFGDETRARRIGVGRIGNLSGFPDDLSNYSFQFEENPWQGRVFGPYAGELHSWPRKDHGAWEIVHAALHAAIGAGSDTCATSASGRSGEAAITLKGHLSAPSEREHDAILRRPDMLTADQVAEQAQVTPATVARWWRSGRVIGLSGTPDVRYPAQQFAGSGRPLPGIRELTKILGRDWRAWSFLINTVPDLGAQGFQALADGRVSDLLQAAKRAARLTEIVERAIDVFGGVEAAEAWLHAPAMALDRRIPAELLTTSEGIELVSDLLIQLDHGVGA